MEPATEDFQNGITAGKKLERKRIKLLVIAMSYHITHSERCGMMHDFAERLNEQLKDNNQ